MWADITQGFCPLLKTDLHPKALRFPTWPFYCNLFVLLFQLYCCSFLSFSASSSHFLTYSLIVQTSIFIRIWGWMDQIPPLHHSNPRRHLSLHLWPFLASCWLLSWLPFLEVFSPCAFGLNILPILFLDKSVFFLRPFFCFIKLILWSSSLVSFTTGFYIGNHWWNNFTVSGNVILFT